MDLIASTDANLQITHTGTDWHSKITDKMGSNCGDDWFNKMAKENIFMEKM